MNSFVKFYLSEIQEATVSVPSVDSPKPKEDPGRQTKINRLKQLQKEFQAKKKRCRRLDEPARGNCLRSLQGSKNEIMRLHGELHGPATKAGATATGAKKAGEFTDKRDKLAGQARAAGDVAETIANGVRVFNQFYAGAAKACANQANKSDCMKGYKAQALQRGKTEIMRGIAACANTSNPQRCRERLNMQIKKYDEKIAKLRR